MMPPIMYTLPPMGRCTIWLCIGVGTKMCRLSPVPNLPCVPRPASERAKNKGVVTTQRDGEFGLQTIVTATAYTRRTPHVQSALVTNRCGVLRTSSHGYDDRRIRWI